MNLMRIYTGTEPPVSMEEDPSTALLFSTGGASRCSFPQEASPLNCMDADALSGLRCTLKRSRCPTLCRNVADSAVDYVYYDNLTLVSAW